MWSEVSFASHQGISDGFSDGVISRTPITYCCCEVTKKKIEAEKSIFRGELFFSALSG